MKPSYEPFDVKREAKNARMTEIEERPLLEPPGMEAVAEDEARIFDENGAIEPEFLRDVTSAIEAGDAHKVRMRAGGLHEADLGLLTASLEPELRPKLIEMMGATQAHRAALRQVRPSWHWTMPRPTATTGLPLMNQITPSGLPSRGTSKRSPGT
jgi:hypothetical protein